MTFKNPVEFIESQTLFHYKEGTENQMVLEDRQVIPDEFLEEVKQERIENDKNPFGDGMVRLARIPEAIVNRWFREGFSIYDHSAQEIMDRLKAEEATAFLTTSRSV